jgi:hypothetical protein
MREICQYIRRGYIGSIVSDAEGVRYQQLNRSKKLGVIVATGLGRVGFSLLSPQEPEFSYVTERKHVEIPGRPAKDVEKQKQVPILDWEKAKTLARARANGEKPNPAVPKWLKSQLRLVDKRLRKEAVAEAFKAGHITETERNEKLDAIRAER